MLKFAGILLTIGIFTEYRQRLPVRIAA